MVWNNLINTEMRVSYGRLTYEDNMDVMVWAASSTFPYSSYPMLSIYYGGEPRFTFSGPKTQENIVRFIDKFFSTLQQQQRAPVQTQFISPQQSQYPMNQRPQQPPNSNQNNMSLQNAFGNPGLKGNGGGMATPFSDEGDDKYRMKEIDGLIPKNEPWKTG
jgi:hypothetical protein